MDVVSQKRSQVILSWNMSTRLLKNVLGFTIFMSLKPRTWIWSRFPEYANYITLGHIRTNNGIIIKMNYKQLPLEPIFYILWYNIIIFVSIFGINIFLQHHVLLTIKNCLIRGSVCQYWSPKKILLCLVSFIILNS